MMKRKLVAAIACRNQGSRLYGKPVQNLDVKNNITILDNIISCLKTIGSIDEIVLGISEGDENKVFVEIAKLNQLNYIIGDETDVLLRLIQCGDKVNATDIFRITSESPFPFFEFIESAWNSHIESNVDATFLDGVIDGCGFEIISLDLLKIAHKNGEKRHRSELCSLYIREHRKEFNIHNIKPPEYLLRKDLRLTVDNPEDLVICRKIYMDLKEEAPCIPLKKVVQFLDHNPELKNLVSPYIELGYSTMYQ